MRAPVFSHPIDTPAPDRMIGLLVDRHEAMLKALRHAADIARDHEDEGTLGFLGDRLLAHDKHAWMLR
jgi:DNA-binding ferritin-like protein